MKYIQIYKSKQITNQGIQLETIDGKVHTLTKKEMLIYDCFSTTTNIDDIFTTFYGDISIDNVYLDFFNALLIDWIQLPILKIV